MEPTILATVSTISSRKSRLSDQPPIQTFDMADILTSYMQANGDDASAFVRPGIDWFHVNASTYDPSDNTVIVSSRENFLIKVNYSTHDIVWILGDPTKYWYTFPSLRAKALTLNAGGDYPIGQHAVSITSDGYVMVFNDGYGSVNQPSGEPAGLTRTYQRSVGLLREYHHDDGPECMELRLRANHLFAILRKQLRIAGKFISGRFRDGGQLKRRGWLGWTPITTSYSIFSTHPPRPATRPGMRYLYRWKTCKSTNSTLLRIFDDCEHEAVVAFAADGLEGGGGEAGLLAAMMSLRRRAPWTAGSVLCGVDDVAVADDVVDDDEGAGAGEADGPLESRRGSWACRRR